MDKLLPAFEETIFNSSLADLSTELIEIGIDSLVDNPLVDSIPVVKLLIGIAKTAQNIHDRNLLKQTLHFLNGFNSGELDTEKIDSYRNMVLTNSQKAEDELGRVLVILSKNIDNKKSDILGRLFRSYINEYISWTDFCDLTEATNGLFISDIEILFKTKGDGLINPNADISYRVDRLSSLGLVKFYTESMDEGEGHVVVFRHAIITRFGELFIKYGLESPANQV